MRGSYPFAVLHTFKQTGSIPATIDYARAVSRQTMTKSEAIAYVQAVIKTDGHPDLLDLYEGK